MSSAGVRVFDDLVATLLVVHTKLQVEDWCRVLDMPKDDPDHADNIKPDGTSKLTDEEKKRLVGLNTMPQQDVSSVET